MSQTKSGTFTGAASATNLVLGFLPDWGIVINTTDVKVFLYEENMRAAYDFAIASAGNANTYDTANGFTPYTGGSPTISSGTTPGNSKGITIGSAICGDSDLCFYIFGENS